MWKHLYGAVIIASVLLYASFTLATEQSYHWGFKPSTDGIPADAGGELNDLLESYGAIYKGSAEEKVIYLTFDNGYENGYTESILNTLREEQVPATFFLTGHYLTSATDLVKQMLDDGHMIGNHSYGHPNMATLTQQQMIDEWKKFDAQLHKLTGIESTLYVRPPEGIFNEQLLAVGNAQGYRHIFWSVAFKDWLKDSTAGADYAYDALMKQLHPGAVILLHTVAQHNALALPQFIKDAKAQGYKFHSLHALVAEYEHNSLLPPLQTN